MSQGVEKRRRLREPLVLLLAAAIASLLPGCNVERVGEEDVLPGRSRPLMAHDWLHPRDFEFAPSSFTPPDATASMVVSGSGLRSYVIPSAEDPVVRVTAALPLGRFYEKEGEAGASQLLAALLTRPDPTAGDALSARVESLGTELEVDMNLDVTRISLEVLAEDWKDGLEIMIDVLRRPRLDPVALRGYRTGAGYDTPTSGTSGSRFHPKVELERILGGYPLAPPDVGRTVSEEAVRNLAARTLGADRVVLGIGGDVPRTEVEAALDELSRGWAASSGPPQAARLPEPIEKPQALHALEAANLEGWIAIGRLLGPVPEAERAALSVMGSILGTRLNIAVREIRGLANHTEFYLPETASGAGLMHVRTGGRAEAVGPLVRFCLEEIGRMHDGGDPISDDELEQAKGTLTLGSWQAALDGARQASSTYAVETVRRGSLEPFLGWPEAVRAVTSQDVKEIALKRLAPNEMVTVVVGPLEEIRRARHPRWPVDFEELESASHAGLK